MNNLSLNNEEYIHQYLTFSMKEKLFGISILNVQEIIEFGEITEVPMTPEFIVGVINVRGRVVPVIDLAFRLNGNKFEVSKRTSIIILDLKTDDLAIEIGVVVDYVNDVLAVNIDDIEQAPKLGPDIKTDFIEGMAKIDDKFLILLDIKNILSVDEIAIVGGMTN